MWVSAVNVLLVDTSSWINYFKRGDTGIDIALKEGRVYTTPVIAAELLSGTSNKKNQKKLISFLDELPMCGDSREHWYQAGKLRASLFKAGFSVSTPDCHICQAALDLEGYLKTDDQIFRKIEKVAGVRLVE